MVGASKCHRAGGGRWCEHSRRPAAALCSVQLELGAGVLRGGVGPQRGSRRPPRPKPCPRQGPEPIRLGYSSKRAVRRG